MGESGERGRCDAIYGCSGVSPSPSLPARLLFVLQPSQRPVVQQQEQKRQGDRHRLGRQAQR